jgi:hypothetical protein
MRTNKLLAITLVAFFMSVMSLPAAAAESSDDFDALMTEGKVKLDFRYRYEFVDQENISEEANAHTLRTRLGFQSGSFRGFDFNIEVNDVRHLSNDFDPFPPPSEYPVVADPKGTRLNQGYINYAGLEDWGFKVGRQRINLDNQRFVGAVGWRQTEQVFDAGRIDWGNDAFEVNYSYVQWVRTIFGPDSSSGKHKQDGTQFVNAAWKSPIGRLTGYYYHLDNEDQDHFSTGTFGVRLAGKQAINDDWSFRYEAEYASQKDAANNPTDYKADYIHFDAFAVFGMFDFGVGWELLEGNEDPEGLSESFRTPLATLHKFNGLADLFLSTPEAGLDDFYGKFKATPGPWVFSAAYHNFKTDDGGDKIGSELDLQVGYKFNDRIRGDFWIADFSGKSDGVRPNDVTKVFLQFLLTL